MCALCYFCMLYSCLCSIVSMSGVVFILCKLKHSYWTVAADFALVKKMIRWGLDTPFYYVEYIEHWLSLIGVSNWSITDSLTNFKIV